MANVPIPEDSLLEAIGALIGGAFLWLLRLERRPRGMTISEHNAICDAKQQEIKGDLTNILFKLDRQDERREDLIKEVTAIKVQTAVLASQMASQTNRDQR